MKERNVPVTQATSRGKMNAHKQSKHEGKKYWPLKEETLLKKSSQNKKARN